MKRARSLYSSSKGKASLVDILAVLYGKGVGLKTNKFAYHQSGFLNRTAFLNSTTIVEVFPFSDPKEFVQYYGMDVDDVVVLIKEGIVFPLVHRPEEYEGLSYLKGIFECKPEIYNDVYNEFYSLISDGAYNDHLKRQRRIK